MLGYFKAHRICISQRHYFCRRPRAPRPQYVGKLRLCVPSRRLLTLIQALIVKKFVDHLPASYIFGAGKQNNSFSSGRPDQPADPTTGQQRGSSCPTQQYRSTFCLHPEVSTSNSSVVVLHNTTTRPLLSGDLTLGKHRVSALGRTAATHVLSCILLAITSSSIPVLIISSLWLYFTGSLIFDVAHYFLHKFSKSRYWILRRIGYLHEVHHLYFNRKLKFNNRYLWQNMFCELPLELSCQLFGTWLGYLAAQALSLTGPGLLTRELFHLVLMFEVIRSVVVAVLEGRDSNHQTYSTVVRKDPHSFLVGPEYHAMHHVNPSAYISSSFRIFDWVLGTSYTLRSRRVTLAGITGTFGQAMKRELQTKESVNCVQELSIHENHENIAETLAKTDILIISHENGSCESTVKTIELFKNHYRSRPGHSLLMPEVWCIGNQNEIQYSSSAGTAFTPHARMYHNDKDIIYRHIVLSTSISNLHNAFLRPNFATKVTLWWIRRGARYVPVTNPVSAFLGYLNFFYGGNKVD
jgi:hypothetical protein